MDDGRPEELPISMISVGINGYGTIGKRVADAVDRQPDMQVAGVSKTTPSHEAWTATERGFQLYAATAAAAEEFSDADLTVEGDVEALVSESDVMVDATPAGVGANYRPLYERMETPAIFQGGEDPAIAPVHFNAAVTYDDAADVRMARILSCNGTGLCRPMVALDERFGVESVQATIVRRGGDPDQPDRGPIDDVIPDPIALPSHHGRDLERLFPDTPVTTIALKVPTTIMHVQTVSIALSASPTAETVRRRLAAEPRCSVLDTDFGPETCGTLLEFVRDRRPRGDLWENAIWGKSICVRDGTVHFIQAIHQESDVVPENVDAIRALVTSTSSRESRHMTNRALGVGFQALRVDPVTQ